MLHLTQMRKLAVCFSVFLAPAFTQINEHDGRTNGFTVPQNVAFNCFCFVVNHFPPFVSSQASQPLQSRWSLPQMAPGRTATRGSHQGTMGLMAVLPGICVYRSWRMTAWLPPRGHSSRETPKPARTPELRVSVTVKMLVFSSTQVFRCVLTAHSVFKVTLKQINWGKTRKKMNLFSGSSKFLVSAGLLAAEIKGRKAEKLGQRWDQNVL